MGELFARTRYCAQVRSAPSSVVPMEAAAAALLLVAPLGWVGVLGGHGISISTSSAHSAMAASRPLVRASQIRLEEQPIPADEVDRHGHTKDLADVKKELRLLAARGDRGLKASAAEMERLNVLTQKLEASFSSDETPTSSPLLLGEWRLDFTDAADVLTLGVIPGAFLELGDIYQNIEMGSDATEFDVANIIELKPRGSALLRGAGLQTSGTYAVKAACRKLDGRRVSLVFSAGEFQPLASFFGRETGLPPVVLGLPSAIVDALRGLIGERVFLETTYLDRDIRVARGPSRELYVLSKA